jgi:molecular chaperone GrpE (heat shock protein)
MTGETGEPMRDEQLLEDVPDLPEEQPGDATGAEQEAVAVDAPGPDPEPAEPPESAEPGEPPEPGIEEPAPEADGAPDGARAPDAATANGGDGGERVTGSADTTPAAEAPARDPADRLGEIEARVASMGSSIAELATLESRHLDLIKQLHADNTKLRDGEITTALKPIFLDLCRLYDDVDDMIERGGDTSTNVGIVRELVVDVLERHAVTRLDPHSGSAFEPGKQVAVGVEATDDPSLDGTVASVRRVGFLRDESVVIRPAQVQVYRKNQEPQRPTAEVESANFESGAERE